MVQTNSDDIYRPILFHMWMTDGYEYFLNPMGGESPDDYNNKTNDLSHPVKKVSGIQTLLPTLKVY